MIHVTDSVTACNLLTGVEPILVAAPAGTGAMTLSVERRRRLPPDAGAGGEAGGAPR